MLPRRAFVGGLLLAPVAAAACGRAPSRPDVPAPVPNAWTGYDDHLTQLSKDGKFSGAVLVAKGDQRLLETGYGMADRRTGEANARDTLFCIGSMGKMFTGVAVAQLVAQRKLSFDDPIGRYVTGFPPATANGVTVHHLLTHTSGIPDWIPEEADGESKYPIGVLMERISREPLEFAPGAKFNYSSAGFVTLGAVIERVADQPYDEYVREHVLAPAGMVHTAIRDFKPAEIPHMAHPYALVGPDGKPAVDGPVSDAALAGTHLEDIGTTVKLASPAGGAWSTVGDLLRFSQALLAHRLLDPTLTNTVLAGKVPIPGPPPPKTPPTENGGPAGPKRTPPKYAYGFLDRRPNGVRIVGHNGGTPGYEGEIDIYPDTGYTVVILTNQDRVERPAMQESEKLLTS
ncbi:serine hydrolase domain-containing protein [Pseudonocardia acaciae]|uniref:serine hydrolase domain-containing protein n=1 Tax=Pseudonocardia acaciae TaxID=551276 RepID=UPI00048C3ACB|nr:serine hydrolase domain-containing protein [Pseudonocardia acaciae]